jgi:hypothetical protein
MSDRHNDFYECMSDSVLCKTSDRNHQKYFLKTQSYLDPRSNTREPVGRQSVRKSGSNSADLLRVCYHHENLGVKGCRSFPATAKLEGEAQVSWR